MPAHPNYVRLGQHILDPPATHAAVARLAPLVARGVLTSAECLPTLIEHAQRSGYKGDLSGLQARLAWALADQAAVVTSARDRSESQIRKDAWRAADALAPSASIYRAAKRIAGPLSPVEVKAIVDDVLTAWLRQRRYRHG